MGLGQLAQAGNIARVLTDLTIFVFLLIFRFLEIMLSRNFNTNFFRNYFIFIDAVAIIIQLFNIAIQGARRFPKDHSGVDSAAIYLFTLLICVLAILQISNGQLFHAIVAIIKFVYFNVIRWPRNHPQCHVLR